MNNLPLVSICIPTYNGAAFLESCLQSASTQTYSHLEILVSDDNSTDDTVAIVKRFQQQDARIRLVTGRSTGMVDNWNNCIEQAKGEWIKYLFQDDILMPECIEKMLATCTAYGAVVGLCRRRFIIHDEVPRHIRHNFRYTMVVPERFLDDTVYVSPERIATEMAVLMPENALGEPTCYFFHKNVFAHTGRFNPDYRHSVDLEFILRLGLLNGLVFLAEPLAWFRVHGQSETSANLKEGKESAIRTIAANDGDKILLLLQVLHNPAFQLLKEAMGEESLRLRINYLFYSGCKRKGEKTFTKALEPLRKKYAELGDMHYNFFKYVYYRKQYRKWEREKRM